MQGKGYVNTQNLVWQVGPETAEHVSALACDTVCRDEQCRESTEVEGLLLLFPSLLPAPPAILVPYCSGGSAPRISMSPYTLLLKPNITGIDWVYRAGLFDLALSVSPYDVISYEEVTNLIVTTTPLLFLVGYGIC